MNKETLMNENELKEVMIEGYLKNNFCEGFILGFIDSDHSVKVAVFETMTAKVLSLVTVLEKPSTGSHGSHALRFRPSRKQVLFIKANADEIISICDLVQFEGLNADSFHNRGFLLESLLTEKGFSIDTEQSPFTMSGDVWRNNKPYQVKFGGRYNGSDAPRVNTAATITTIQELQDFNIL